MPNEQLYNVYMTIREHDFVMESSGNLEMCKMPRRQQGRGRVILTKFCPPKKHTLHINVIICIKLRLFVFLIGSLIKCFGFSDFESDSNCESHNDNTGDDDFLRDSDAAKDQISDAADAPSPRDDFIDLNDAETIEPDDLASFQ